MTRFIHDQFAKDYLEQLLTPYGEVQAARRVAGEVRQIDVYFIPKPQPRDIPRTLGLLGQIVTTPSLLEPFRNGLSYRNLRLSLKIIRGAWRFTTTSKSE